MNPKIEPQCIFLAKDMKCHQQIQDWRCINPMVKKDGTTSNRTTVPRIKQLLKEIKEVLE